MLNLFNVSNLGESPMNFLKLSLLSGALFAGSMQLQAMDSEEVILASSSESTTSPRELASKLVTAHLNSRVYLNNDFINFMKRLAANEDNHHILQNQKAFNLLRTYATSKYQHDFKCLRSYIATVYKLTPKTTRHKRELPEELPNNTTKKKYQSPWEGRLRPRRPRTN